MLLRRIAFLLAIFVIILTVLYYFVAKKSNSEIIVLEPAYVIYKKKPDNPGVLATNNSETSVYENLKRSSRNNNYSGKLASYVSPDPEKPLEIIYNQKTNSQDGINSQQDLDSIDAILDGIEELYEEQTANNMQISEDDHAMPNPRESNKEEELESKPKTISEQKSPNTEIHGFHIIKAPDELSKLKKIKETVNLTGGYKLQLAVAASEKEAKELWDKISSTNSKILQNSSMVIRKVNGKNDRIFYLVLAGTYPSLNEAKLVCKKLSNRKQNCIITK